MRRTRRLLLLGILVILGTVAGTYYMQKSLQERHAPPVPEALPAHVNVASKDWVYTHTVNRRPVVEVRARDMRQIRAPDQLELEGVELHIFHNEGQDYDRVRCARADFDLSEGYLFSDGEVEITLAMPAEGPPRERQMVIRSSGVRFESKTGKAATEREASFTFGRGEGRATGASYDPSTRELRLSSRVELRWKPKTPEGKLMEVEAGGLVYREEESKVYLSPWSRLKRGSMTLEAADSVVHVEGGAIRRVDARKARGRDVYPSRSLEYEAGELYMDFAEGGAAEKVVGIGGARLVALSETARTSVSTDHIDMEFEASSGDSLLRRALANGGSVLESRPLGRPGASLPETRILRSETIETKMREGGKEIEVIETHTPGQVEFLPNRLGQKRRRMQAERMWIHYAADNQIRSFRAVSVSTRTENEAKKGEKAAAPTLTWSKDLSAEFDPKTREMIRLEQWQDFRYEECSRKATADKAVLEARADIIRLEGKARVWDPTGAVTAERIVLEQKSGDFTAEGQVSSARLPESKERTGAVVLSDEEPVYGRARRMSSREENARIVYEGEATLWQGANRIQGDRIEIDRKKQVLAARGNVASRFMEEEKESPKGVKNKGPVFTLIEAPELVYAEKDRLAHYRQGVLLERGGLKVKSRELRAYLREAKGEGSRGTSLDYALADGNVEILDAKPGRTRRGLAEHAEYYAGEERVVLRGGRPRLIDSARGTTQGRELTYFAGNDRLLVDGTEAQPAASLLHRN